MKYRSQLKYLVLSDLHLGEKDSLLTPEHSDDPKLVNYLGRCLADLNDSFNAYSDTLPGMILNGDILGLAFSSYSQSLPVFKHLLKSLISEHQLCDHIVYIPGNHDHHIWNLTKEQHYLHLLRNNHPEGAIPNLQNSSPVIFDEGFKSDFLEAVMVSGSKVKIRVYYPNFLLAATRADQPNILFHHGHFSEDTYRFNSLAMQAFYPKMELPMSPESLESDNGSWIDFAFSQVGRSGEAGKHFERLMNTLSQKEKLESEIEPLSRNLAKAVNFPYLPMEWTERILARTLLSKIAEEIRSERYQGKITCSDSTLKGLLSYVSELCSQILDDHIDPRQSLTVVWGHTHKPFEKRTSTDHYPKLKIVNSGGWVLPPEFSPKIGASIVIVDQYHDVQSLRLYNDGEGGGRMIFEVKNLEGDQPSQLQAEIMDYLYPGGQLHPLWEELKSAITNEIQNRRKSAVND